MEDLPALKILMTIINLQKETFMEDPPPTAMDNIDPQLLLVHSMHTPTHHAKAGISNTYLKMMVIENFKNTKPSYSKPSHGSTIAKKTSHGPTKVIKNT